MHYIFHINSIGNPISSTCWFFFPLFRSTVYPARFLRTPSLFPPITPYPYFAKLPNCRCVRRRLSYTAPHLPRTRGNCEKPVSVQTTIYFSDSSISASKESEELTTSVKLAPPIGEKKKKTYLGIMSFLWVLE